ncbi:MAG: serine hydrolase [Rhodospirillaceae bacterium]|nr:serine hydrolase [Rhodospirillaceae bacterium]
MDRRSALSFALLLALPRGAFAAGAASVSQVLDQAGALRPLKTVVVAQRGAVLAERGFRGHKASAATNIKSASKSIIAALVGIAIDKGLLTGVDQPIAALLEADLPAKPDPLLYKITVGHLLSMQAGLARTSGANYGRWVQSKNWVRAALAQPFDDAPGGEMLYSTGSSHLLSAILTRAGKRSTLDLARAWLGPQEGFAIGDWQRDPQGIYMGGNQMAMSARSLLAFGELFRTFGKAKNGQQLISPAWIESSWTPRTNSRFTGDGYGYGWFVREIGGHTVPYAWGFGGQMLYIAPSLDLTVAMTSDDSAPAGRTGHRENLHALMAEIVQAVQT